MLSYLNSINILQLNCIYKEVVQIHACIVEATDINFVPGRFEYCTCMDSCNTIYAYESVVIKGLTS